MEVFYLFNIRINNNYFINGFNIPNLATNSLL